MFPIRFESFRYRLRHFPLLFLFRRFGTTKTCPRSTSALFRLNEMVYPRFESSWLGYATNVARVLQASFLFIEENLA